MGARWVGVLLLVALGVFIWFARATANGFPDGVGWAGLMVLAVMVVLLVLPSARRRSATKP